MTDQTQSRGARDDTTLALLKEILIRGGPMEEELATRITKVIGQAFKRLHKANLALALLPFVGELNKDLTMKLVRASELSEQANMHTDFLRESVKKLQEEDSSPSEVVTEDGEVDHDWGENWEAAEDSRQWERSKAESMSAVLKAYFLGDTSEISLEAFEQEYREKYGGRELSFLDVMHVGREAMKQAHQFTSEHSTPLTLAGYLKQEMHISRRKRDSNLPRVSDSDEPANQDPSGSTDKGRAENRVEVTEEDIAEVTDSAMISKPGTIEEVDIQRKSILLANALRKKFVVRDRTTLPFDPDWARLTGKYTGSGPVENPGEKVSDSMPSTTRGSHIVGSVRPVTEQQEAVSANQSFSSRATDGVNSVQDPHDRIAILEKELARLKDGLQTGEFTTGSDADAQHDSDPTTSADRPSQARSMPTSDDDGATGDTATSAVSPQLRKRRRQI